MQLRNEFASFVATRIPNLLSRVLPDTRLRSSRPFVGSVELKVVVALKKFEDDRRRPRLCFSRELLTRI